MSIFSNLFMPYRYISGCTVSVDNSTRIPIISTGFMRDDTNSVDMVVNTPITLFGSFVGANGLDIGTLQTAKVYAVYVLADPSGVLPVAGLISLSLTTPQMPAVNGVTYGVKRLVGFVRTPSSFSTHNFSTAYVVGQNSSRTLMYNCQDADIVVSTTSTSSAQIALSTVVPPILNGIAILYVSIAGPGGPTGYISTTSPTTTADNVAINLNPLGTIDLPISHDGSGNAILNGLLSASSSQMYLAVLGFRFEV